MAEPEKQLLPAQPEPTASSQTQLFYSNYASLSASPEEFVFRFCLRNMEDPSKADEVVRVFISPGHAKRMVVAMAKSLKAYEEMFGNIPSDPLHGITPEGRKRLGLDKVEKETR